MPGLALGLDIGNAKIKACLARAGEAPRWLTRPLPYDDRRRYDRFDDFERGVPAALSELLGEGDSRTTPDAVVVVTSAGYAYPTYREGVAHVASVVARALPEARGFFLSATLELVPLPTAAEGEARVVGPIAFSNPNGAAFLARRLGLLGPEGHGVVLDTGGQTTGTVILAGSVVDPAALADPARHVEHRTMNGKLVWVGLETTPLEWLATDVSVGGRALPVIPRGVLFQNVAALLGLDDAARARKLALFGLFPSRAQALRAMADAVNLDPDSATEEELVELAGVFHGRAVERLADGLRRAIATAPERARRRAAVFGVGAIALAAPALRSIGLADEDIALGADHLPSEIADAASCFGACHAGLELLHGGAVPVFGARA